MKEAFLKRLFSSNIKCKSCGQFYSEETMEVLGHQDETWFMSAVCPRCQTQAVIAALVKGSNAKQVLSEPEGPEQETRPDSGPLEANDVLDMHNFLKDFHGDISDLTKD